MYTLCNNYNMPIKVLTFVDDLGRFPRIWGCGNYQAIPY